MHAPLSTVEPERSCSKDRSSSCERSGELCWAPSASRRSLRPWPAPTHPNSPRARRSARPAARARAASPARTTFASARAILRVVLVPGAAEAPPETLGPAEAARAEGAAGGAGVGGPGGGGGGAQGKGRAGGG